METDKHPAFFGYGSLVNRSTHDYAPAVAARLTGWQRVWRQTRLRPYAFLSVEPADGAIDGLVAAVPGGDWAALDLREAAYDRIDLAPAALAHDAGWAQSVAVYCVSPGNADPQARYPILLSYLDVVAQGFLQEFGVAGLEAFFASTAGWECGIHNDRAAPLYPRHRALSAAESNLVNDHLRAMRLCIQS